MGQPKPKADISAAALNGSLVRKADLILNPLGSPHRAAVFATRLRDDSLKLPKTPKP